MKRATVLHRFLIYFIVTFFIVVMYIFADFIVLNITGEAINEEVSLTENTVSKMVSYSLLLFLVILIVFEIHYKIRSIRHDYYKDKDYIKDLVKGAKSPE